MIRHPQQKLFLVLIVTALTVTAQAQSYTRPKVRAITAFVRLEPATRQQEIAGALSVLRAIEGEFEKQGSVSSIEHQGPHIRNFAAAMRYFGQHVNDSLHALPTRRRAAGPERLAGITCRIACRERAPYPGGVRSSLSNVYTPEVSAHTPE
jgi:hypothetical protein